MNLYNPFPQVVGRLAVAQQHAAHHGHHHGGYLVDPVLVLKGSGVCFGFTVLHASLHSWVLARRYVGCRRAGAEGEGAGNQHSL